MIFYILAVVIAELGPVPKKYIIKSIGKYTMPWV